MTRIGIYTLVTPGPHSGVGRQLYGLLDGLQAIDRDNEYLLFGARRSPPAGLAPNFRWLGLPLSARARVRNHLFVAALLPLLAARRGLELLHIPNAMPLLYRRLPTVVTLYDLTEFALPERVYPAGRHAYRRLANRLAARGADRLITTSRNTACDLVRCLGVEPGRIQVIYPGIDHERFRPQALDAERRAGLARAYGLPDRYVLYVGKIQPRKNLARLLAAFQRVRRAHADLQLVLAGERGWMSAEVDAAVERLGLAGAVHFTGFVADDDLPAIYGLAELLVFPSLYEGFGFPVLEAMACGTPVVTAATSALGETAGDAALCVDPTSAEAIAAAIEACLCDPDRRETLRQRGLARAQHFNWRQCARETLACYLGVVCPPVGGA
jgi:glycosyltransferase involved in cell wall biosynthesis